MADPVSASPPGTVTLVRLSSEQVEALLVATEGVVDGSEAIGYDQPWVGALKEARAALAVPAPSEGPGEEEAEDHAERIAQAFHERYERLAPGHGYAGRPQSWVDVPEDNRALMMAVVIELLDDGVIAVAGIPSGASGLREALRYCVLDCCALLQEGMTEGELTLEENPCESCERAVAALSGSPPTTTGGPNADA
ncbi:MAG: hypothetical protein LC798_13085 [Chloroflexi bacterium]|nr:hypothetical protein [Chloroflexota bacterium]